MASSGIQMNNYQGGEMMISNKDKTTAGILGILLGWLGIHRMYMGFVGIGLLQIVVTIFTFGLGGWWGFIEGILILVNDDWTDSEGRLLKGNEKPHLQVPTPPRAGFANEGDNKFQKLKELNELKEQGVITPEEFEREKRKIL